MTTNKPLLENMFLYTVYISYIIQCSIHRKVDTDDETAKNSEYQSQF